MADKNTKKERKPLATALLSEGDLYFNFPKYRFLNEHSLYNKLGKALLDFSWLDENHIAMIFEILFDRYVKLKNHKDEYAFVAMGLIQACEKLLMMNIYFSTYLITAIDLLLEGYIDRRVLTLNSEIKAFSEYFELQESGTNNIPEEYKKGFFYVFRSCIFERQSLVRKTLDQILGEDNIDGGQSAMERLYKMESEDKFFRKHWHSRFESYIGKVNENADKIENLTVLYTIDDMMRYELVQMILQDVSYKRCQCCGQLFLPTGRPDALYCGRIMPGQERPCNEVGANIVAVEKRRNNPELRVYRQAYERLYKRVEMGYMEQTAFTEWGIKAREKRDACHAGEFPFDEFVQWIDETSRPRQTKPMLLEL
jgi:hypothetical protein